MNKNYDYVLGENSYDCGIASIITILKYYGINPSREKIVSKYNRKNAGYTAYDLIRIAKDYGLDGYGLKTTISDINKFPVIAHTIKNKNMFHFIVIFEKNDKNKTLKVMDPSIGITELSYSSFEEMTTGIFLLFKGSRIKNKNDLRFRKEIIKIFQSYKKIILKTLFVSLLYVVFSLLFNYYLKTVLVYHNQKKLLFSIFLIFIIISLFKNSINYFKNKLMLDLSIKIDKDITKKVTNHILNLPYEYFLSKTTGELVTIVQDIENFKLIITKVFVLSLVDFILVSLIVLYLFLLNFYFALFVILLIIISLLITKKYQFIFNDKYINLKMSKIDYNSSIISYFTSFETIKNLNISKRVSSLLSRKYKNVLRYDKNYNKKLYNYEICTSLIIDMFYLFLIFFTLYFLGLNGLSIYNIVLFSSVFYLIIGLINNINEGISFYKVYQTSTNRVLDCLEVKCDTFNKSNFHYINSVEFKNIKYNNSDNSILNNLNLRIKRGDKVFITGKSGVGKSTLMKMLLLYFTPSFGNILIDDIDINDYDLSFIRDNITYIGQNESLFAGSIMDNLNLVSNNPDDIDKVCKITLLDDFLKQNKADLNFYIEENGVNISGGERKKIILARGLLHFKNVLVLDEVFNEISSLEEKKILENIFNISKDKIVIMISHRKDNIDLFRNKYNLKGDGKIYEIK